MKTEKEVILEAIKTMQAAKKYAKIFPTGISEQEVFTHLECRVSSRTISEAIDGLFLDGAIKVYPTIHGRRMMAV